MAPIYTRRNTSNSNTPRAVVEGGEPNLRNEIAADPSLVWPRALLLARATIFLLFYYDNSHYRNCCKGGISLGGGPLWGGPAVQRIVNLIVNPFLQKRITCAHLTRVQQGAIAWPKATAEAERDMFTSHPLSGELTEWRTPVSSKSMNRVWAHFWLAARYSPRLYFAPLIGAIRGVSREYRRIDREFRREVRRLEES